MMKPFFHKIMKYYIYDETLFHNIMKYYIYDETF